MATKSDKGKAEDAFDDELDDDNEQELEDEEEDDEDEEEDDEDEDEDEEEDEEEEDDEDEEDEPASGKSSSHGKRGEIVRSRPARRRRKKRGSPTRNVIGFVVLVVGLALLFAYLGNQGNQGPVARPTWKKGQTVSVEITIVTTDYKNLTCAMSGEIAGKHCAFEAQNKKNPGKEDNTRTNDKLLQPFTTVDQVQFMAAGLWMQPALKTKLDKENWDRPSPRFTVKCKYKVEGKTATASVQWKRGDAWHPGNNWWTGSVSDCAITKN